MTREQEIASATREISQGSVGILLEFWASISRDRREQSSVRRSKGAFTIWKPGAYVLCLLGEKSNAGSLMLRRGL